MPTWITPLVSPRATSGGLFPSSICPRPSATSSALLATPSSSSLRASPDARLPTRCSRNGLADGAREPPRPDRAP